MYRLSPSPERLPRQESPNLVDLHHLVAITVNHTGNQIGRRPAFLNHLVGDPVLIEPTEANPRAKDFLSATLLNLSVVGLMMVEQMFDMREAIEQP